MPDIVITPNRGTSNNPKIDFTGTSAGTIKLEVLADGSIAWNGANGSLFSIADSLSGSLMSVNDISGLPAFEVFSDNRVIVGQFGANLLLGKTTSSSNGRLQLATHTTVAGGIGFGTDIGLYRLASNKLSFRGTADAEMSLRFERTGGSFTTTWENYIPVGSTDLKWFNGADKFTLTASGNATFSGYVVSTSGFATSGIYNYAFLQTTDSNNFWITPGNNQWGLYFETSAGGLLGGTGDSNRLGFVGNATARFYVDLNNGNGWFGGTATATQLISNVAQGTAPLVVTSTTQVSNLNAQYLNGYSSDTANTANTIVRRDGSGNFSAGTITATLAGLATSETLSTVTGRGATTASQISVNSSAGGSMLTGTKAGGTYGDGVSGATFKSILDNANGGAAFAFSSYYGGSGGTLGASIRADGYAYFKEDVGIGTNSPSGKLDVRVAGTGTWDRFIVTTTTSWGDGSTQYVTIGAGGAAGIMLSNPHVVWNSGNSAAGIRMGRSGGISSGAWYEVGTGTSDSFHIKKESTTRLYIDTNGNVGIGTTSPSNKLHLLATTTQTTINANDNQFLIIENTANGSQGLYGIGFKAQNGVTQAGIFAFNGTNGGGNGDLRFYTRNTSGTFQENMRISDGGNVGISQTSPSYKLDVSGTLRSTTDAYFATSSGSVGIGNTSPSYKLHVSGDIYANGGWFRVSGTQGYYFQDYGGGWFMNDSTWIRAYNDKAIITNNEIRATIFKDANDTAYYADPASTSVLSKLSVGNAPYVASIQAGALELGRTDTNYQYISGWTGTMQGGILANCADNWEFVIHDSGHRLASAFEFRGSGTNVIRLGRDLGWGVTPIETPGNLTVIGNAYAPVFYDYNDTNFRLDPASTTTSLQIAGAIEQGNNFAHPNVEWAQSGSATGMVIIKFPGNTGNYGMIHAVVDIYEYSSNSACTVTVAGHNWNGAWYNISSEVIGYTDKQVRVGVKDSQYCIVIGTSGSSWSYGQVRLRKIQNGSYYNDQMDLGGAYSASITTTESFSNISGDLRNLRTPVNFVANNNVTANGNMYTGGWYRTYNKQGIYNETYGMHFYAENSNYYSIANNGNQTIGGLSFRSNHEGTLKGYVYWDSTGFGLLDSSGAWSFRTTTSLNEIFKDTYIPNLYANLMYDRNDTAYYVNPASTSVLNIIQPNYNNGAIGPSATTAPTNGHNDVAHSVKYLDGYGAAVPNGVEGSWWQGSVAIGNATRGFQLAGGYSVQSLWYRRGADGWQSWVRCLNTSVDPYPSNMNQYVRSSDNVQFNSIGVAIAASGTAGSISLNQSGTRSWTITPTGGNLAFASGDGLGAITYGGSIRATSFFDISNTSYYVDPASTSVLNSATFASDITVGNGASNSYIYMGDSDEGTRAIHNNSNRIGFLNQSSGWGSWCDDAGYWESAYSIRGPVFYDSNDTTYYVDPSNTTSASSNLRGRIHISGGHYYSSLRVFLPSSENSGGSGTVALQMWCSEPGNTWDGAGFGYNVDNSENNGGSAPAYYFGRVNTSLGQSYMRFLSGGDWYFYNTNTSGTRTLSLGLGSDGIFYAYNHIRTPYIYDSNNTAYYFDGNNTSVMNLVTVNSLGVGTSVSGTTGEIRATNNITAYYSDERLKTRLGKIEDPIEKVKSLSGFYFEANETAVALGYDKKREVGVSAQEVQAVLPEIIAPAPISDKYMTVRYEKLIPLLIEAIKEQQTQIEQLSNELKSLKNKL